MSGRDLEWGEPSLIIFKGILDLRVKSISEWKLPVRNLPRLKKIKITQGYIRSRGQWWIYEILKPLLKEWACMGRLCAKRAKPNKHLFRSRTFVTVLPVQSFQTPMPLSEYNMTIPNQNNRNANIWDRKEYSMTWCYAFSGYMINGQRRSCIQAYTIQMAYFRI